MTAPGRNVSSVLSCCRLIWFWGLIPRTQKSRLMKEEPPAQNLSRLTAVSDVCWGNSLYDQFHTLHEFLNVVINLFTIINNNDKNKP